MNLNPHQQRAVETTSSRVLVVASAGSGKTTTYIERIMELVRRGADPKSIAAITFTNAAANEIISRLEKAGFLTVGPGTIIKPDNRLGYVGTLHGFLLRLLMKHGRSIGLSSKLTVLDADETEAAIVDASARLQYKGTRKALDESIALGVGHYKGGLKNGTLPQTVAYEYYYGLATSGALTYDTILEYGLELVRHLGTSRQGQYEHLRNWEHLLVDEVQDANSVDMDIYNALPVKTRFFVGDPDQSIYGFRGGDVNVIMDESRNPETEGLFLSDNYRCGTAVVTAANNLIAHNRNRIPKTMVSGTCTTGHVYVHSYDSAAAELAAVASSVETAIRRDDIDPNEIAILTRTNALAATFKTMLTEYGIPVRARNQVDTPLDYRAARAFLTMLTDPESNRAAKAFLAIKLGNDKAEQMLREATSDYTTINDKFLQIESVQIQDVTTAMSQAGISIESIGIVRSVIDTLPPGATLQELQLALNQMDAEAQEEGDGVKCCTIHHMKGAEASIVFMPACEEGIIPSNRDGEDIEESRRLFYVGVTRAKERLIVSHAAKRKFEWRGLVDQVPSRFIKELTGE